MILRVLLSLFAGSFCVSLGLFVYFKNPKSSINRYFCLINIGLFFWNSSDFIGPFLPLLGLPQIGYYRASYAGAILLILFLLNFYSELLYRKKTQDLLKYVFYLVAVILFCLLPTRQIIKDVATYPAYQELPGTLYSIFAIYFIGGLLYSQLQLIKEAKNSVGEHRNQIFFLLFAMLMGMISSLIAFFSILVNPKLSYISFYTFEIAYISFTAYAITKHRLMDISVVISRSVAEVLTIIFLGSIYLSLVWLHLTFVSSKINWLFLTWTILYGILVGQIYQRTRLFIQTTSDKLFLRGKYDYYKELSEVATQITKTLSMENILNNLRRTFYEVIEVSNPRIYLSEDFDRPEVRGLLSIKELTFKGEDLIVPCMLEDRLIALIVLGKKLSEDPYTEEDLRLLRVLASQAAVAIDHTRTYEQVKKDFEASQKKLYEAERMLEHSQRLASLGTIAAGVAHEIRNPLGIIQLAVEQFTPQKITNEAMLEKFKEEVKQNIKHITNIVRSMLSLTKGEKKEITEVDLNEVINATLELFTIIRIRLIKELNPLPKISGNPEELKQVFINLIDNAIHAMPEGGDLRIKSYQSNDAVVVEVSDTGIGIDEKDLPRIFDPFFSTRHEGVGLGLSIVYRIVREHSGEIEVKSQKGKGTTFTLKFPAKV